MSKNNKKKKNREKKIQKQRNISRNKPSENKNLPKTPKTEKEEFLEKLKTVKNKCTTRYGNDLTEEEAKDFPNKAKVEPPSNYQDMIYGE